MRIYTLLKSIIQKLNLIGDYVVEEGTSGIWTYRKWSSGIAECWGTQSQTGSTHQWGSAFYITNELTISAPPTGLFTSVTQVLTDCRSPDASFFPMHYKTPTPTNLGIIQGIRATSATNKTIYYDYHVIGRWK